MVESQVHQEPTRRVRWHRHEATLTPATGGAAHGVHIEVDTLSQRIRVRKRGEVTLLDTVSFTLAPAELIAALERSATRKRKPARGAERARGILIHPVVLERATIAVSGANRG